MARESEKRRIIALIDAIRRKQGGPDLSRLNDEQRQWFDKWQERKREYAATFDEPDAMYSTISKQDYIDPFPLRRDIQRALWGEPLYILETDSERDAADKYQRALER